MIRCIMQTEFVINTCVTALISIIDIVVCYAVIEKTYYLICFPRKLSQTSAGMVMSSAQIMGTESVAHAKKNKGSCFLF